ncbi:MAG: ABC transporter permease [Thermomicrobiales bacterium]|nr:ABC transporter permease [Thermomicrobiales bacterium]
MASISNRLLREPASQSLAAATPSRWRRTWQRVRRQRLMLLGLVIFLAIIAITIAAPLIAPRSPEQQQVTWRLKPPGSQNPDGSVNWLGTDQLGRDVLSRTVYGGRLSLVIALTSAIVAGLVGLLFGLLAGYFGGAIGVIVGRLSDLQLALPLVLVALVIVGLIGSSLRNIVLVFIVTSWPAYARMIRASTMRVKHMDFVEAGHALGARTPQILRRHIFPNVLTSLIVLASFDVSRMIQLEASLGFLGLGVQPPTPTWGNMLADGRGYLTTAWWIATFPGIAIVLTSAAVNFIGDGLRDILDPRMTT